MEYVVPLQSDDGLCVRRGLHHFLRVCRLRCSDRRRSAVDGGTLGIPTHPPSSLVRYSI